MINICLSEITFGAAPPVVSQLISVASPLSDEFGQTLKGTDVGASFFGHPVVEGDVVHIYLATNGVIYPPNSLGVADARNTLLMETRIGRGSSAKIANPGTFSTYMTPRPADGSKLFVRVFNAPAVEQASFYMDSQLFTVSWTVDNYFIAEFATGIKPLDIADNDGDGLNNSWEKSYGTNPGAPDSDGDGLKDTDEIIAGTNPSDETSSFVVADLLPIPPDDIRLTWKSERDRIYTVEKKEGLDDNDPFNVVNVVNGNGSDYELIIPNATNPSAFYRVKVALQTITE